MFISSDFWASNLPQLCQGVYRLFAVSIISVFCGRCSHYPCIRISPNEGKDATEGNVCQRWLLRRRFSIKIVYNSIKTSSFCRHVEIFLVPSSLHLRHGKRNRHVKTREMGNFYAVTFAQHTRTRQIIHIFFTLYNTLYRGSRLSQSPFNWPKF